MRSYGIVKILMVSGLILMPGLVFADIYDFKDGDSRNARFIDNRGSMFMLNTEEFPNQNFPSFVERTFVQYIEKVRYSEPLLQSTLDQAVKLLEQGNNYFFKRDYRNAIRLYQDALRVNPKYRFAYNNLAVCHLLLAEYNESISWSTRLIDVEGLNGYAYFYRGLSYSHLENYIRAYDDLKVAKAIFEKQGERSETAICEELLEKLARRKFPY